MNRISFKVPIEAEAQKMAQRYAARSRHFKGDDAPTYAVAQESDDMLRNIFTVVVDMEGEIKGKPVFDSKHDLIEASLINKELRQYVD
jgi:hypothetical protein